MEHPPLYREVLRQAWHLTWRHKIIWVFGLFAAFLGTGGALEVLARHLDLVFNPRPWPVFWLGKWSGRFDWIAGVWSVVLGLLLLGIAAFFIFVVINSFSALILSADQFRADKKKMNLAKTWHKAGKKFWPIFGAVVLFKILIVLFGSLSVLPLWLVLINQAGSWLLLFYPLIFILGILVVLISSFLMIYVCAFILLEAYSWHEALLASWQIFRRHWLVNIEMAVIIFLINLLAGLAVVFGAMVIAIPVILIFLASIIIQLPPLGATAVAVGLLLATLLILWVASILGAFQVSAWVLLWRRMHKGTAVSKLVRLLSYVKNRL